MAKEAALVEVGSAGNLGDRDLARVDQLRIDAVAVRPRTHSEHSVLGVQDHPVLRGEKVRDPGGLADAEVHIAARRDVGRDQPSKIISAERAGDVERQLGTHPAAPASASGLTPAICTMRSTKIPGVTTTSGSIPPGWTISATCTTVVCAAVAITGPKLRAVFR